MGLQWGQILSATTATYVYFCETRLKTGDKDVSKTAPGNELKLSSNIHLRILIHMELTDFMEFFMTFYRAVPIM